MDSTLRRSICSLMLVVTVGMMAARVVNVEFLYEPSLFKAYPGRTWPPEKPAPQPSFGSNDRARWATVKSLVENGEFRIGERIEDPAAAKGYRNEGILFQPGFGSVDVVLHPETKQFYSTKPQLLTLIAAGQYWIIHNVCKKSISEQRWETVVPILLLTNVLPLALALLLFSRLLEVYGKSDWGRLYVFAVACFGTFLPTFANTLNNHVPAACCIMYSLYALIAPASRERKRPEEAFSPVAYAPGSPNLSILRLAIAGLFAGMAASMDLPAAAFGGMAGLLILVRQWRGIFIFGVAAALPLAVQTYVNYRMVGIWEPVYSKFGTEWYEYAGSHWAKRLDPNAEGIDFAKEDKHVYAFHLLAGHHGLFSLTPVWLLAVVGFALSLDRDRWIFVFHKSMLAVLLIVIGFYIFKSNNYGGWTCGPRWFFWLTPPLLLSLIPIADSLSRNAIGRGAGYLCLAVSAFSTTYPWANPWRHPWIYQLCEYMGWVKY